MRDWLRRNKIYFETVGIVLPSIVALIVAAWSLSIAMEARDLSAQQVDIGRGAAGPLLQAETDLTLDENHTVVWSQVNLVNYGPPAREIDMEIYSFLDTECGVEGQGVWEERIPVRGYFKYAFLTGDLTGTIAKLVPADNYHRFGELYRGALHAEPGYATPVFDSVVSIRYETAVGEQVTEYFRANPHSGSDVVGAAEATRLIEEYEAWPGGAGDVPDFSELDVETVRHWCGLTTNGDVANT